MKHKWDNRAMSESKVTIRVRRLFADHRFQALRKKAQADPENVQTYVQEARSQHRLSNYWSELLPAMLLNEKFDPAILAGAVVIESHIDPVTGKVAYKLCIPPEATLTEVKRAHRVIREREKLADLRYSGRYLQEFRALELQEAHKPTQEIIKILKAEFNKDYDAPDVASLIQKAKQKAKL